MEGASAQHAFGMPDVAQQVQPGWPGAEAWKSRVNHTARVLSTVHFCYRGYWFWIIPLSTGHHSLGIVAGEEHHPFETFARPETAMAWIQKHEPVVYEHIKDLPLDDFKVLRRYAYTSEKVYSTERWACIGEAGVFVDPLYSPGSDLIAIAASLAVAMTRAPVASVAALRETSVLFATVLGTWMLKERFGWQRAIGTVVIVGGVMALRLA